LQSLTAEIWIRQWRASLPEMIRGFGHVKEKAVGEYRLACKPCNKLAAHRNRLITVLCDAPASLRQIAVVAARFASQAGISRKSTDSDNDTAATARHILIDVYVNVI
jgi:hypothetical protein